jgi:hypothetical protein
MKRKLIPIFVLSAMSLFFTACQPNEDKEKNPIHTIMKDKAEHQDLPNSKNGITMKMEKEQYLTTDKELSATFQNNSDIVFSYGRHFSIEKKVDNTWYSIPFTTDLFGDIGLQLNPHEITQEKISLIRLKDALSPGEYRLLKSFNEFNNELSEENQVTLATIFKVKEP